MLVHECAWMCSVRGRTGAERHVVAFLWCTVNRPARRCCGGRRGSSEPEAPCAGNFKEAQVALKCCDVVVYLRLSAGGPGVPFCCGVSEQRH